MPDDPRPPPPRPPDPAVPPVTAGRTLDHAAAIYDWAMPVMSVGMERPCQRRVESLLQLSGNERILDVGCGTGSLTLALARRLQAESGGLAVGLDAAPKMIAVARRKAAATGLATVRFDIAAAETLPYLDASFDCGVSSFFFHHVNFELKVRCLKELRRVMVPGGRLVIADVDIPTTLFGRVCAWSGFLLFQQEEIRENIRGRLREAFAAAGWTQGRQVAHLAGYISVFDLRG